jgi:alpha-N-arabinofuranosidase
VIDEWGNWYRGGTELQPSYILSQAITLRDALHTAITFDAFNRHADKVAMANVAQTINCLHSLFFAVADKYVRTPVYYAFEMYRPHMGARLVPMQLKVPALEVPLLSGRATLPGLSGSASIRDRSLCVTLTNPSLDDAVVASIRLEGGGRVAEGRATTLGHEEITAANTFERPDTVTVSRVGLEVRGDAARVTLPRHSVVALELRIA